MTDQKQITNEPAKNFNFETTNIGGTEYVSREQIEEALRLLGFEFIQGAWQVKRVKCDVWFDVWGAFMKRRRQMDFPA
jgi:hypothetical protein